MKKNILIFIISLAILNIPVKSKADFSWQSMTGKSQVHYKVLEESTGGRIDWSATSNTIAYDHLGEDGYYDVYTMKPDGSQKICLTCVSAIYTKHNGQPAWHPSGQYIAFQRQIPSWDALAGLSNPGAGVNNNIWIMNSDGSNAYPISNIEKRGNATLHPQFSPDGSKITWAQKIGEGGENGDWAIILADFMGKQNPPIVNMQVLKPGGVGTFFYETHGFSKDGSKIIFSSNLDGQHITGLDIYTYTISTKTLVNLTNSPLQWDEHAHYSPAGNKIVWMSNKASLNLTKLETDLWVMNEDGSNKQQITFFNSTAAPEYFAEGVVVADTSWNKEGTALAALAVFEDNLLPAGGQRASVIIIDLTKTSFISSTNSDTILGDINKDGIVNSIDFSIMNLKWDQSDLTSDLNNDGIVNGMDYTLLVKNWQKPIP